MGRSDGAGPKRPRQGAGKVAYCDYDFYLNTYLGDAIAEADFPRLIERASDYVRAATKGLSDRAEGAAQEAVKKAACAVADVLLDEEILNAGAFAGGQAVSSESVGSWSKSYRASAVTAFDAEYLRARKRDALALYFGALPGFSGLFGVRAFPCLHRRG